MPTTVTLDEAQTRLKELIGKLAPGDELIITEGQEPVARLVKGRPAARPRPGPGLCQGMVEILADDEDHLKDFAEYMS